MISIITTSFNYENYISETIKSVLAQTYSDWELIIIDDASTDNSVEIIKKFQTEDRRIKLICHNKNKGLKEAIKTGLKYAQGEWIAFLESDDTLINNALELRLKQLQNDTKFIFNNVNLIGDENWIQATKKQIDKNEKILSELTYPRNMFKDFLSTNPILTLSSVMFSKEILDKISFNSPIDALSDWWFYIHICFKNEVFYMPEKLTNWRIHNKSYIKKTHKPYFCFVNTLAYFDIFKKQPSFELLNIILKSFFKMCLIRLKVYFIGLIRLIKKLLGLQNKKSPLFD